MIYGKYCVRNSVLLDYLLQLYKINYKYVDYNKEYYHSFEFWFRLCF